MMDANHKTFCLSKQTEHGKEAWFHMELEGWN